METLRWEAPAEGPAPRTRRYFFREERDREREDPRDGTFAPERRASDKPIAIACLRFLTRLPDPPERSLPRFISPIARSTFWPAFGPYFRPPLRLEERDEPRRLVERAPLDERLRLDDPLRLDVRLVRPARLVRFRPVLRLLLDLR